MGAGVGISGDLEIHSALTRDGYAAGHRSVAYELHPSLTRFYVRAVFHAVFIAGQRPHIVQFHHHLRLDLGAGVGERIARILANKQIHCVGGVGQITVQSFDVKGDQPRAGQPPASLAGQEDLAGARLVIVAVFDGIIIVFVHVIAVHVVYGDAGLERLARIILGIIAEYRVDLDGRVVDVRLLDGHILITAVALFIVVCISAVFARDKLGAAIAAFNNLEVCARMVPLVRGIAVRLAGVRMGAGGIAADPFSKV